MCARIAAALLLIVPAFAARAEPMNAEQARHFVVGKLFSYTCFEGTRGSGRIHPDLSVSGTIQVRGSGPFHHVRLPPNTLRVKGGSVCASVRGLPFDPCFNIVKTSHTSFRGSIYGLSFAYCEFQRRGRRIEVAAKPRRQAKDLPLRAAIDAQ